LDGQVLASGFYWSGYQDDIEQEMDPGAVPEDFLRAVICRVEEHIRFWVLDVARTEAGDWIVVELNDAQMSGLSAIEPEALYKALRAAL
jgi:hypothetical protein